MKPKIKTSYLIGFAVIIILVLLFNYFTSILSSNRTKPEELFGKIKVWSEKDNLKYLKLAATNFKKLHPNVQIDFLEVENDKLYDKITSGFATNSGVADLISVKNEYMQSYESKFPEGFLEINNISKDDFLSSQIHECLVKGKLYGIPWQVSPSAVLYRKDIFQNFNVAPEDIKTWKDYIDVGKVILFKSSGAIKMLPFDENGDMLFSQMLNQLNSGYYDENGKVLLKDDSAVRAMKTILNMKNQGIMYSYRDNSDLISELKNEKIATLPYNNSFAKLVAKNLTSEAGLWDILKLPSFEPGGSNVASTEGTSVMISKASKNKLVASEFAKFAMSDKDTLTSGFIEYNFLPAYKAFYDKVDINKNTKYFNNKQIWSTYIQSAKESNSINFTDKYAETRDKVITAQKQILSTNLSVEDTLNALQQELEKNIKATSKLN